MSMSIDECRSTVCGFCDEPSWWHDDSCPLCGMKPCPKCDGECFVEVEPPVTMVVCDTCKGEGYVSADV